MPLDRLTSCHFLAGDCITPDDVMDLMEEDVQEADLILWVSSGPCSGVREEMRAGSMDMPEVQSIVQMAAHGVHIRQCPS